MTKFPALEFQSVRRQYGEGDNALVILDDADFTLASGEMVALVAPSGAGKSTLLHLAGLLEQPNAGHILVEGADCTAMNDQHLTALRRQNIGFVYQFHHLLPEFSALENIMIPQMIAGLDKEAAKARAVQLLDYMRIGERGTHRPAELSGGEQQRVAIARAVANAPKVLLADEPTGTLDPTTANYVFERLEELVRQSGLTMLIATQNHELAKRMDRQVTLENKKIVNITL